MSSHNRFLLLVDAGVFCKSLQSQAVEYEFNNLFLKISFISSGVFKIENSFVCNND